jgi:repressor LexA
MDGDILAVKSAVTAENNQVVVARLGTDVTVKRFKRENEQSKTIELIAENPAYEPIVVDLEHQEFAIEGIAVGVIRNTIH